MAIKKQVSDEVEERVVKVKAKVNLKYDKDVLKTGEEFLIRLSDIEVVKNHVVVISNLDELKKAAAEEYEKAKTNGTPEK